MLVRLLIVISVICAPWMEGLAQEYPSRPIRLIVDGPTGGNNDIWARRYAAKLSESLRQTFIVENKPGASGTIAAEFVANSPADGYTVLFGGLNPIVAYPSAGGVVRFDPEKDFVPVAAGTLGFPLFVAGAKLGVRTFQEFVERARSQPEQLTCATAGHAGVQHFACAMLGRLAGVKIRMVPYKGSSQALLDAANGTVDVAIGYTSELEPFTGATPRLVPLTALAPRRLPKFPGVPTLDELGLKGLDLTSWAGFFVPRSTPRTIVDKLNAEAVNAMSQRDMKEWVDAVGAFFQPWSSVEFARFVSEAQQRWKKMSADTGIRVE